MTTTTELGRIWQVPHFFGGVGISADWRWERAFAALEALADGDPILSLLASELSEARSDVIDAACRYGQAVGPDGEPNLDVLEPDEYEARTGKKRKI